MPHDEDHNEPHPFHVEGSTVIFDKPPSAIEAAREAREREAHEFARNQVRTNKLTGWFNGLLVLATSATVGIGVWQGSISQTAANAAKKAADESVKSTYLACLSAQATQKTFLQMQMGALDAHASTIATVEQTAANLFAERAEVVFSARWPLPAEVYDNNLELPYTLKNAGHSTATTVKVRVQALLLADNVPLRFVGKGYTPIEVRLMSPGREYSNEPVSDKPRMTYDISVHNINGKTASGEDSSVQSLLAGGPYMIAVYGYVVWSDFSGKHRMRFCEPLYKIKGGTFREGTENERKCVLYNVQTDHYDSMPKLASLVPPQVVPIEPIACKDPNK